MSHAPARHFDPLLLGLAVVMTGWLVVSLRSGKVFFRYRMVERATNPVEFWSACVLTAALAALGGGLFLLDLLPK